jgi:nitrogen-specific signal transduction histidine kinase
MSDEHPDRQWEGSVLADFDAGELLDPLSLGIMVLDAQLCAIYANSVAEALLAVRMEKVRGQPLAPFLPQPQRFLEAAVLALEAKETLSFDLAGCAECPSGSEGTFHLRLSPLREQLIGPCLLLEVRAARVVESERSG